jgi:hypothetical protein
VVADGSRRGKTTVEWEAAFAYYAALPPGERSYVAVGAHFGVSARTVETHGRTGRWKQRLRDIDAQTAARTIDVLADARVEEIHKLRRLIEASLIGYAERLRDGMRMSPADLERLNRLSLALIDETANPAVRPDTTADQVEARTPEHTAAVLAALEEVGALEHIGLTRIPEDHGPDPDANPATDQPQPSEEESEQ